MEKKYEIKTIKELLSVVNDDNVENFKKDFCSWLDFRMKLKELVKLDLSFLDIEEVGGDIFKWIDDGKTGINLKIIVEEKEE